MHLKTLLPKLALLSYLPEGSNGKLQKQEGFIVHPQTGLEFIILKQQQLFIIYFVSE